MKLPIGIQLYSVRNEAEKDLEFTLRQIKDLGYDGVELAGSYGRTPEELKSLLDEIGLVPVSAHVSFSDMRSDFQKVINDHKVLGCEYIAIPWLDVDDRLNGKNAEEMLKAVRKFAKIAKENGINLCYHNHQFEFEKIGEEYAFDLLFKEIPDLFTEQDSCWVAVSGESPVEYLKKYSNRTPLLHLKDYSGNSEAGEVQLCPVGYGVQDFKAIIQTAETTGVKWLIVEQDEPGMGLTALQCAEKSIRFLKTV